MESKNIYSSWKDSFLAKKITESERVVMLSKIWDKASEAYPRATWQGWIDHSSVHVLGVLRNLDRLIPTYVFDTIQETEAFVLIIATLLHDLGMIPEENDKTDLQYFANLRLNHGRRSAEIIQRNFRDLLEPWGDVLYPVCEIVQNHHGNFNPIQRAGLAYDLRADALWVRLADELDFGPHHAPAWLLEYIRPGEDELKHWIMHNHVQEPAIDLDLFRLQIMGTVEDESLIKKLRAEFEAPQRQDLQKIFLSRGLSEQKHNRTFLIWDMTEIKQDDLDDIKSVDSRPAIFSNEQFLVGARYLYNLGRYEIAQKSFEDGVKRLTGRWSDMPATPYFYHYLKTLHGLGKHRKALDITDEYKDCDFTPEIDAAMAVSNSFGYWKLGDFTPAIDNCRIAISIYKSLSVNDIKQKVNEADAWTLYSIIYLETIRTSKDLTNKNALRNIEIGINNAEKLFLEYERSRPGAAEAHYKGRFYGLRAFFCLLQIDLQNSKGKAGAWDEALEYAKLAYGGENMAERNPFGAMCGKYSAAAVNYHILVHCESETKRRDALHESSRIIAEVLQTYYDLFGTANHVYRLWPKIQTLYNLIRDALPKHSKSILPVIRNLEAVDQTEIYTPLN